MVEYIRSSGLFQAGDWGILQVSQIQVLEVSWQAGSQGLLLFSALAVNRLLPGTYLSLIATPENYKSGYFERADTKNPAMRGVLICVPTEGFQRAVIAPVRSHICGFSDLWFRIEPCHRW